ncbi:unnamed protein product [Closterium sp. Yama58-4]|nr:unnamed protein product [Closterium sp. Yama58-4]
MKSSASDETHGILKIFQWLVRRERTLRQVKKVDQGLNPCRALGNSEGTRSCGNIVLQASAMAIYAVLALHEEFLNDDEDFLSNEGFLSDDGSLPEDNLAVGSNPAVETA